MSQHKFIDCPELTREERNRAIRAKIETRFRVIVAEPEQPQESAISPELSRLYSLWEQLSPGSSLRPGVAAVREMVANKELTGQPRQQVEPRAVRKRIFRLFDWLLR